MSDKLKFILATPERGKLLPIPMTKERWLDLAGKQNDLRMLKLECAWSPFEMEELWAALGAAA